MIDFLLDCSLWYTSCSKLKGIVTQKPDRATLIHGFLYGFSLDYVGPRAPSTCNNLRSATQNPAAVNEKLEKELHLGRIAGPFDASPLPSLHISPLGLIPKKTPGEFRLIHHLSFPYGNPANSHIPKAASSVHYASIDDAIRLIRRTGRGCALAKTDVKNAFRLIPISPADYDLLGIFWGGKFYFDKSLPMGASSSCKIWEAFSSCLEWVARHKLNISGILYLLGDFTWTGLWTGLDSGPWRVINIQYNA